MLDEGLVSCICDGLRSLGQRLRRSDVLVQAETLMNTDNESFFEFYYGYSN